MDDADFDLDIPQESKSEQRRGACLSLSVCMCTYDSWLIRRTRWIRSVPVKTPTSALTQRDAHYSRPGALFTYSFHLSRHLMSTPNSTPHAERLKKTTLVCQVLNKSGGLYA